jgi:hypothetical protein
VKYKIYTWNGWYKSLISHFKLKGNVWVVKYTLYTWNRWYKTNNVWKVYNGKIEVVFFVIESGRKLTIGVKFEVSVKTCGRVVSDLLSECIFHNSYITLELEVWNQTFIPSVPCIDFIFHNSYITLELEVWNQTFIPSVPCIEFIFHNSYITLELEVWNQTFIPSVPCIEFIFHNSYIKLELEVWNQTFYVTIRVPNNTSLILKNHFTFQKVFL